MKKSFNFKKSYRKHFFVSLVPFFFFVTFGDLTGGTLGPFDIILDYVDEALFKDSTGFESFAISLFLLALLLYFSAYISSLIHKYVRTRTHQRIAEIVWTLFMMPLNGIFCATSVAMLFYAAFIIFFLPIAG